MKFAIMLGGEGVKYLIRDWATHLYKSQKLEHYFKVLVKILDKLEAEM